MSLVEQHEVSRPRQARPKIVNPLALRSQVRLLPPTGFGYVYLAAAVHPGRAPFVLPNSGRSELIERVRAALAPVIALDEVIDATAFRAIAIPPTARFSEYLKHHVRGVQPANFDVMILIRVKSPSSARELVTTSAYQALEDTLRDGHRRFFRLVAENARRIGSVDTMGRGLFLFNHFVADDPSIMLELWERLAAWYAANTGLDNSEALVPLAGEGSDYAIVNFARWNVAPVRHFWHQLSKRSFWNYVLANLEANRAAAMPIYCRRL